MYAWLTVIIETASNAISQAVVHNYIAKHTNSLTKNTQDVLKDVTK